MDQLPTEVEVNGKIYKINKPATHKVKLIKLNEM